MKLKGKTLVVTSASSGIGAAAVLVARTQSALEVELLTLWSGWRHPRAARRQG